MLNDLQMTLDASIPLGQKSPYPKHYDRGLLHKVARSAQRAAMKIPENFLMHGFDVWNAYELFWHNHSGKPVRAHASFFIPANSVHLCESKSVKLYLNSLNHEKFSSADEVKSIISQDLRKICSDEVMVFMNHQSVNSVETIDALSYRCLDDLDITISKYQRCPEMLKPSSNDNVCEKLVTHLFKSHCLCTGQPDLGSIFIEYEGRKIDDASLLSYLVSYRDHVGFSENCIEQIFVDIKERLNPHKLLVFGRFTRRGGIDINPYRSTHSLELQNTRLVYQ